MGRSLINSLLVMAFLLSTCPPNPGKPNAPVAEPTAAAPLPAGRQATVQRDESLPLVKADGLAEEQAGDHPAQQHQVALVADRAVLTQKTGELTMEPGVGIHEGLDWCENPKLSWFPAHPMS